MTDGGSERDELSSSLVTLVHSLGRLEVLKLRLQASCMTPAIVAGIVAGLKSLQRLKLTCSDGWTGSSLFIPLTGLTSLRKCSLAHFKQVGGLSLAPWRSRGRCFLGARMLYNINCRIRWPSWLSGAVSDKTSSALYVI